MIRRQAARRIAFSLSAIVILAIAWMVQRQRSAAVVLPPPHERESASLAHADFVGADRCAGCHSAQYAAWRRSTHGRAGGPPSRELVIAPFQGAPIVFADARVTPRLRHGAYEFLIEERGRGAQLLRVDGVIGGGHIYGGGTQGFVTAMDDGTLRFIPFEWSRQAQRWFCNTNARSGRGWTPITPAMRLAECGDWPPVRVIGDDVRFANCQSCHASQATLALDSASAKYVTQLTSLAINCESCHGPARRHVELAERGALRSSSDVGMTPLGTLGKEASLRVCYQCHALKDRLRDGFLSTASLTSYYSLELPLLGDRPLFPDGRTRTFAYQEGHQYSDCYLNGGMTCTSCHDPHGQGYRDTFGNPLEGRFDDRQCTSCHAAKAVTPEAHSHHPPTVACTSCHMPLRQQPETRAVHAGFDPSAIVPYARSDHTISIPRPTLDAALGLVSACATCHAGMSVARQEDAIRRWWGSVKPMHAAVAAQLHVASGASDSAASLLAGTSDSTDAGHTFARFAALSAFIDSDLQADAGLDDDTRARLESLSRSADVDIRAAALAAIHLASGSDRRARRFLAAALRAEHARDADLRARWAVVLGYMGDRAVARGNPADATVPYTRALEVTPSSARLWLSLANAERDAGNLAGALDGYRRSVALDGRSPLTWVNYGIALGAVGDTNAAITALTNATTLNPFEPLAWFNLGNVALVRGQLDRAGDMYGRAAALEPSMVEAHFQLARVDLLRHDERAALAHLQRGLAFDSSDASARSMAAELMRRLSNRR